MVIASAYFKIAACAHKYIRTCTVLKNLPYRISQTFSTYRFEYSLKSLDFAHNNES